jgi:chemotaxis protein methyltransferase CheR
MPDLSDTVFRLLADLVRRRTGFVMADAHKPRLASRLLADARAAGSFYQLYTLLRDLPTSSAVFGRLLDASVNGETYFFRDPDGLAAFADEIAPERLLANGGLIDIWSAGCATGEEPYTLAMLLAERGVLPGRRVRIRGSDLSPANVRRAREGLYGLHSLRATNLERRGRHFEAVGSDRFRVRPPATEVVTFESRPLLDEPFTGDLYDVIVCRNVLIYFDEDARRRVAEQFVARLKPGGYLLLGPSDALAAAATSLTLVRLSRDVAYRK